MYLHSAFDIFQKVVFAGHFTQKKKICKFLSRFKTKLPMHKYFDTVHWFLKNRILPVFQIVKIAANYAEISCVGKSDAGF